MKITILNGNPQASSLDSYLSQLQAGLKSAGHTVTNLMLRDLTLRHCVGCWGCWVKTPGECQARDASHDIDRTAIQADFLLWAAPLKMGFPAELLKRAMDKFLPLIHPYIEIDQSESHHLKRYPRYPRLGLLLEPEASTDDEDMRILTAIHCRTALNFKTRLEFCQTTGQPVEEVARRISLDNAQALPLPGRLPATRGESIQPPTRLTLFNGSPRGAKGNTPIFLRELAAGFGSPSQIHHLVRMRETDQMVQAFAAAQCVVIGFPLYTDSMPAVVKHFIEALEPLAGRDANPPMGFVVQSGFPEALHSRYVERYLQKLAARFGSPYLGTIVKGGGEATRLMPPKANQALFTNLRALGAGLANQGRFDAQFLRRIAAPEYFAAWMEPLFRLFLRLPISRAYFDDMLKANAAYERRFAQPYAGE